MAELLLKNVGYLVTCDDEDRVLAGTDLLVRDGVVSAIGPGLEAPDAEVLDCSYLTIDQVVAEMKAIVRRKAGL